ncbi:MAG: hypothetical protein IPM48_07900 [Saprospiraceae bacterium]|nr:hypothetical protein [Saprospiraceae bacterium]
MKNCFISTSFIFYLFLIQACNQDKYQIDFSGNLNYISSSDLGLLHNTILDIAVNNIDSTTVFSYAHASLFIDSLILNNLPEELDTVEQYYSNPYFFIEDTLIQYFGENSSIEILVEELLEDEYLENSEATIIEKLHNIVVENLNGNLSNIEYIDSFLSIRTLWHSTKPTIPETPIIEYAIAIGGASNLFWENRDYLDNDGNVVPFANDLAGALLGAMFEAVDQTVTSGGGSLDGRKIAKAAVIGAVGGSISPAVARGMSRWF